MQARLLFAQNLRYYRRKKDLSQEELAEMSNLHRTYVSAIERGIKNISIDNMEKLANALGVDLTELVRKNGN